MSSLPLLPSLPKDPHLRDRLEQEMVRELIQRTKAAIFGSFFALLILWQILHPQTRHVQALPWMFGAMGMLLALRFASLWFMERAWSGLSLTAKRSLFFAGVAIFGSGFGAITLMAAPHINPVGFAMLSICLIGICSIGMQSMAPLLPAYHTFLLLTLGSLGLAISRHPFQESSHLFIAALILYLLCLVGGSLYVHESICSNILLRLKMADMALRDPMTGLRNRRYLGEFMESEIPRIRRSWSVADLQLTAKGRSMALIMLDLDLFKPINDTYGHAAGDAILVQFAHLLRDTVRRPDLVIRWGGDEFAILALDTGQTPPNPLCERIRASVATHLFELPSGQILRMTCSLGYAALPFFTTQPDLLDWEQVLHIADKALYLAKAAGKNRVCGLIPGEGPQEAIAYQLIQDPADLDAAIARNLLKTL